MNLTWCSQRTHDTNDGCVIECANTKAKRKPLSAAALWLYSLMFLDVSIRFSLLCVISPKIQRAVGQDDSLFACCLVSKRMAAISLSPHLWRAGGRDNTKKTAVARLITKHRKQSRASGASSNPPAPRDCYVSFQSTDALVRVRVRLNKEAGSDNSTDQRRPKRTKDVRRINSAKKKSTQTLQPDRSSVTASNSTAKHTKHCKQSRASDASSNPPAARDCYVSFQSTDALVRVRVRLNKEAGSDNGTDQRRSKRPKDVRRIKSAKTNSTRTKPDQPSVAASNSTANATSGNLCLKTPQVTAKGRHSHGKRRSVPKSTSKRKRERESEMERDGGME